MAFIALVMLLGTKALQPLPPRREEGRAGCYGNQACCSSHPTSGPKWRRPAECQCSAVLPSPPNQYHINFKRQDLGEACGGMEEQIPGSAEDGERI